MSEEEINAMTREQLLEHLDGGFADANGKPLREHSVAFLRDYAIAELSMRDKSAEELRRIAYGEEEA